LKAGFERVPYGAPKGEVIRVMGTPDKIIAGCDYMGSTPRSGCAEQYVYHGFWGTFLDEAWTVSLDRDGLVVDKAHFVSP
jgi:hypothetical protein